MVDRIWQLLGAAAIAAVAFWLGTLSTEFRIEPETRPVADPDPDPPAAVAGGADLARVLTPAQRIDQVYQLESPFARYAGYIRIAELADEEELRELIFAAQRLPKQQRAIATTDVFFSRYAELNPVGAIELMQDNEFPSEPSHFARVYAYWAQMDLDAAIESMQALTIPGQQQVAGNAILSAYVDEGQDFLEALTARLNAGNPDALPNPNALIAKSIAEPEAALNDVVRLPTDVRIQVAMQIGRQWVVRDPETALGYAQTISDPPTRQGVLQGILYEWVALDTPRVIALLDEDLSPDTLAMVVSTGIGRMARAVPEDTFNRVREVQNSGTRQQATQLTLQLWAQQDPYAASAALDRLAATEQSGLANSIAYEFVRLAPAQALEWAARHDGSYGSTWRYVMTELAKLDAETSFGLASGMPEEARSNALRIALGGMADSNPEMAAEYLIRVPEPDQRASIGQIVSRWSRLDADAARNWVMRLAPGDVRDQGLAELLRGDSVGHDTIIALLNAISGQQTRDSQAASAIRAAIRAESVADAEMLLSQVRLSPDTYSAMRAQIEAARN